MHILAVSIFAWFLAQLIKVIWKTVKNKKISLYDFISSGGMPSSHSALVTALSTQVALFYGLDSIYFAICAVFSVIVMYDAAGVRRAVGLHAQKINQLIIDENNRNSFHQQDETVSDDELKEILGHTPLEVLGGVVLGLCVSFAYYTII